MGKEAPLNAQRSKAKRKALQPAAGEWLAQIAFLGRAPRTQQKYRALIGAFTAHAAEHGFSSLDCPSALVQSYAERFPAPATRAKALAVLCQFFEFYRVAGYITSNPAAAIPRPRPAPTRRAEPLTVGQVAALLVELDAAPGYDGELVRLLLATGLRIGDAVGLRASSLVDGGIRITTEKTSGKVVLPLPELLYASLRARPGEYVFWQGPGSLRTEIRKVQRRLKRAFLAIGAPSATPHTFRHTLASRSAAAGASTRLIADILGISERVADRAYIKWTAERGKQVERLLRELNSNFQESGDRPPLAPLS